MSEAAISLSSPGSTYSTPHRRSGQELLRHVSESVQRLPAFPEMLPIRSWKMQASDLQWQRFVTSIVDSESANHVAAGEVRPPIAEQASSPQGGIFADRLGVTAIAQSFPIDMIDSKFSKLNHSVYLIAYVKRKVDGGWLRFLNRLRGSLLQKTFKLSVNIVTDSRLIWFISCLSITVYFISTLVNGLWSPLAFWASLLSFLIFVGEAFRAKR